MNIISPCVAIFGGAVSGAEAAFQLSQIGIHSVLFEQNCLPYGKIEDGLPKWHAKLRDKEEAKINEKLNHPCVHFVPNIKLGVDIDFSDVVKNWGFTAVILATGAWKDRPLPIKGIDSYEGKGLYYQNPFFIWYNHYHEPNYQCRHFMVEDGAIIVGGGLASIDVAKAVMMETVEHALKKKGILCNMFELDKGIDGVLTKHNLTLDTLGLKGCTLYYRRRAIDMPLADIPDDAPRNLEKVQQTRVKILEVAQRKFLFHFKECHAPVDMIVENGRLTGLVFSKTEVKDNKVHIIEESRYTVQSPLVISSIGSIPEMIEGMPAVGETFDIENQKTCKLKGFDKVFIVGNAVTGKGNIKDSFKHSQEITARIINEHLNGSEKIDTIADSIPKSQTESGSDLPELKSRVLELWKKSGYNGDYAAWIRDHTPKRLEEIIAPAGH